MGRMEKWDEKRNDGGGGRGREKGEGRKTAPLGLKMSEMPLVP